MNRVKGYFVKTELTARAFANAIAQPAECPNETKYLRLSWFYPKGPPLIRTRPPPMVSVLSSPSNAVIRARYGEKACAVAGLVVSCSSEFVEPIF